MTERMHKACIILTPVGGSSSTQSSDGFTLTLATVSTVEAGVQTVRNLRDQGLTHVELSENFGDDGLAQIRREAGSDVRVGRVRYET